MTRRVFLPLLSALLAATALAQTPLETFLAPLQDYPGVRAAREQQRSAQLQLDASYDPVQLQASGGYSRFDVATVDTDPVTPGTQGLPESGGQISADLTLRPFAFGDIADQADQNRIKLEQARLSLRDTLTQLQVQAVQAAVGVELAQEGVAAAQTGAALAQQALEATRTRAQKGAATAREVRDAETGAAEAANVLQSARGGLEVARLSLRSLVGDAPLPPAEALALEVPDGTPASVERARLDAALAGVGIRNARRSVYPVAQASYTWNLDDRNSVGVSLESRTLQPKVSYTYQDPGRSFPQDQIHGTFQIGVSVALSPGVFQGLEATDAQLRAAQDGVDAAERAAEVQRAGLDNDLAQARAQLTLAQRKLDDAEATLSEAQTRERLGLDIPLTTQRAALDRTQRALDLAQAQRDVLAKTLAYYTFFARPLTEVPQ